MLQHHLDTAHMDDILVFFFALAIGLVLDHWRKQDMIRDTRRTQRDDLA